MPIGSCFPGLLEAQALGEWEIVVLSGSHPRDFPPVVPAGDDYSAAYYEGGVVPDAAAKVPGDHVAFEDFAELMSDAADRFDLSDQAYYRATAEGDRAATEVHSVVMLDPIDQEYDLTALFAEPIDELHLHDLPDDSAVYGEYYCGMLPDAAAQGPGDQMALEDFFELMSDAADRFDVPDPAYYSATAQDGGGATAVHGVVMPEPIRQESDPTALFPKALKEFCERIHDDSVERRPAEASRPGFHRAGGHSSSSTRQGARQNPQDSTRVSTTVRN